MRRCAMLGLAIIAGLSLWSAPAVAGEQETLGVGRLFTNDVLGDGRDRWKTGSYTVSIMRGTEWTGTAPTPFGALIEYRLRGSVIAPRNLSNPSAGDRPYVGMLSVGAHSHSRVGNSDLRAGMDLVFIGPQTGAGDLQDDIHNILNQAAPDLSNQLSNDFYPTGSFEASHNVSFGLGIFRPFVGAQVGIEDFARIGGDVILGTVGEGELLLRDDTSGHLYRGIRSDRELRGANFVLGADATRVFESALLPEDQGPAAKDIRARVRAGVHFTGLWGDGFYGVSWLSPEFEGQGEGQIVGSLNIGLKF